ncbi:unnamed protein product [Cladocopium goreaui]|uniref:Uncharacterized protein n=1 Tax=Cladocopium goreaui TaxID=2562237 RepID=A0A9P1BKM8_9DINO|nr:unnamed protein product [Cladocopium goreaui]
MRLVDTWGRLEGLLEEQNFSAEELTEMGFIRPDALRELISSLFNSVMEAPWENVVQTVAQVPRNRSQVPKAMTEDGAPMDRQPSATPSTASVERNHSGALQDAGADTAPASVAPAAPVAPPPVVPAAIPAPAGVPAEPAKAHGFLMSPASNDHGFPQISLEIPPVDPSGSSTSRSTRSPWTPDEVLGAASGQPGWRHLHSDMWCWCILLTWHLANAGTAEKTWSALEDLAKGGSSSKEVSSGSYWQQRLLELHDLHPHPEASAVLSWLYLFGLPSETRTDRWHWSSSAPAALVERDIDKAIQIARDAAKSNCARCLALLGFILSIAYPPLLGAAHLAATGRLVFLGEIRAATAGPRRPRDVGAPDPAAAAYAAAAEMGDALGILAASYLRQKGLINDTLKAPMANQASCMVCRTPELRLNRSSAAGGLCSSPGSLGHLATEVVEQLSKSPWGPLPTPLTELRQARTKDTAFVEHVLADVSNAAAADLAQAATLLEGNHVDVNDLPDTSRRHADVQVLYTRAAEKGERRAALRTAVEHLQRNETEKAKPLLEKVSHQPEEAEEPMAAMAQYYLTRFSNDTNSSEEERRELAWPHLVRAADLGRQDAELLVAHAHLNPPPAVATNGTNGPNGSDPGKSNSTEAARRYRRLVAGDRANASEMRRSGNLSEVQAFAAYNLGVLSLQSLDDTSSCSVEAQELFQDVALSHGHVVRLILALERRAARLGDVHGALLLAMLLSDLGHELGHLDAAHLWDRSTARPRPADADADADGDDGEAVPEACDLHGWWSTNSSELLLQNVSKLFASKVKGGGFEMFNASGSEVGVEVEEAIVLPRPETTEFQHLHSFLWHTTYDAFPAAAPVPVALQPPGAVPHLVEFHHQRGKLTMDKSCQIALVEGMYVNWTFHRLDAVEEEKPRDVPAPIVASSEDLVEESVEVATRDWLHCWVRPERYYVALKAALAEAPQEQPAPPGTWEEVMSLTTSKDCPCYGGFACRRGDGACEVLAKQSAGAGEEFSACQPGSSLCQEVPPELDPPRSNWAASPEVCAFYFYRRAAADGNIDAMHVLSHAYSNGHRGAPKDPVEAFHWSERAMALGDLRGHFDVAYSKEFGLGTAVDAARAKQIYQDILTAQGLESDSLLGQAAASFLSLAASGRYVASRLLHHSSDWVASAGSERTKIST